MGIWVENTPLYENGLKAISQSKPARAPELLDCHFYTKELPFHTQDKPKVEDLNKKSELMLIGHSGV